LSRRCTVPFPRPASRARAESIAPSLWLAIARSRRTARSMLWTVPSPEASLSEGGTARPLMCVASFCRSPLTAENSEWHRSVNRKYMFHDTEHRFGEDMMLTRRPFSRITAAMPLAAVHLISSRAHSAEFVYKYGNQVPASHPMTIFAQRAADRIRQESNGRL